MLGCKRCCNWSSGRPRNFSGVEDCMLHFTPPDPIHSAPRSCHGTPRNCLTAQTSIYVFIFLRYFCLIGTNPDTSLNTHTSENFTRKQFIRTLLTSDSRAGDNKHLSWTYTSHQSWQRNCASCLCYHISFTVQSGVRIGRRVTTYKTNIILTLVTTCMGIYMSQGCPRTCHNWHTLGDGLTLDSLTSYIYNASRNAAQESFYVFWQQQYVYFLRHAT
jgi:hypothetical protein